MTKYFVNRKYVLGNRCQIEACNWRFNAVIKTVPVTFYLIKEKIYNYDFFFSWCNNNIIHTTEVQKSIFDISEIINDYGWTMFDKIQKIKVIEH